jgi:hypothetical protein
MSRLIEDQSERLAGATKIGFLDGNNGFEDVSSPEMRDLTQCAGNIGPKALS